MFRQLVAAPALAIALLVSPAIASQHETKTATSTTLPEFDTESAAQKHCPSDTVVWLNTNSGHGLTCRGEERAATCASAHERRSDDFRGLRES